MKTNKIIAALLAALCVSLSISHLAFADEYIYGYFRYTVEDQSVTITGYYGDEAVVTVPAMIGGNPVNTIASGAFSGSSVSAVYLPDTITSIEGGAFGPGQAVIYSSFGTTEPETGESGEETTEPAEIPTYPGPIGIWDDQGNLITTDDEHNLILVDPEGNERVLDGTQDYEVKQNDQGDVTIYNKEGGQVMVYDGGTLEFTDGEGWLVSTNTNTGGSLIMNSDGNVGIEEVEIDLDKETAPAPAISENTSASAEVATDPADVQGKSSIPIWPFIFAGAVVIIIIIIIIARRLSRKR